MVQQLLTLFGVSVTPLNEAIALLVASICVLVVVLNLTAFILSFFKK